MNEIIRVPENSFYKPHTDRLVNLGAIVDGLMTHNSVIQNLDYHGKSHTLDPKSGVAAVAYAHAINEDFSPRDTELSVAGAYLHDIGLMQGSKDHEERGGKMGIPFLYNVGFNDGEIEDIVEGIMATKVDFTPGAPMTHARSHIGYAIADADVDNFGRSDFFERGTLLTKELGVPEDKAWYQNTLNLLKKHDWYTNSAKQLRGAQKEINMEQLEGLIHKYS